MSAPVLGAEGPPRRAAGGVRELVVEGVTLRFGGITALDDVRFAVAPGTVHALIGPNGAGKSSCFNVISGLYRPTVGRGPVRRAAAHLAAPAPAGRARHRPVVPEHRAVPGLDRAGQRAARPARADQRRVPVRRAAAAGVAPADGGHAARVGRDLRLPGHRRPARRPGRGAALRRGQAGRHRPRAGRRADPAAAGRAGGRAERRGDRGDGRDHRRPARPRWASRCCWSSTTWAW